MKKNCIVDFDNTLLRADSMWEIIKGERIYYDPDVLFWGIILFFVKSFISKSRQIVIRENFKFNVLRKIDNLGGAKIIEKYADILSQLLNKELAHQLNKNYERIVVITSSWQPLVETILLKGGIQDFEVYGTVYNKGYSNFSICWNVNKLKILEKLDIGIFDLFTDSQDDAPLMARADKVIMV